MSESRILIFTNTQGYPISISDCVPIYSISNERLLYFKDNFLDIEQNNIKMYYYGSVSYDDFK